MANSSEEKISFDASVSAMEVGIQTLVFEKVKESIAEKYVSEEDFLSALNWFDAWHFDVPFILASGHYFEPEISYSEAKDIIEAIQENYESLELDKRLLVLQILNDNLFMRIKEGEKDIEGTFTLSVKVLGGKVSVD